MITDTVRYDGNVRLPEACRFCGSEDLTGNAAWTNVNPYSHDGNHATVLSCEDCGGKMVQYATGNKRHTQAGLTTTETRWEIPEGYALAVCPVCGIIIDTLSESDPADVELIERINDDTEHPQPACHDVAAVLQTSTYRRAGDGTPVEDGS